MTCDHFQAELTMLVGEDAVLSQRAILKQHVDECSECRVHLLRLRESHRALQVLQPAGHQASDYRSVRSQVLSSLRTDRNGSDVRRFNQLVASVALAAGLLAAVCISNSARLESLKSNPVVVSPATDYALPGSRGMSVPQTTVSFPAMDDSEANAEFQMPPDRTVRRRLEPVPRAFFDF